jgi:hypothetical protein
MKLRTVNFDEFIAWMGRFDEDPNGTKDLLMEAANELPVLERLMMIMSNAMENHAPEEMIRRNADLIQFFAALFQLEKEQDSRSRKRLK